MRGLDPAAAEVGKRVEAGKKAYAGIELPGHTLGVIGLGKIRITSYNVCYTKLLRVSCCRVFNDFVVSLVFRRFLSVM